MFKSINEGKLPIRSTIFSAGIDVFSNENIIIKKGAIAKIKLGIAIDKEKVEILAYDRSMSYEYFCAHHYLELKPRSSLRAKGLISHSGVIDLDYPNEIMLIIYNPLNDFKISKGDKIGQLLLIPHKTSLIECKTINKSRKGGFGSTGN